MQASSSFERASWRRRFTTATSLPTRSTRPASERQARGEREPGRYGLARRGRALDRLDDSRVSRAQRLARRLGADDYLTKPFSPRELVARMKAVLRRTDGRSAEDVLTLADVELNRNAREVAVDGQPVELTTKEFDLLATLLENPGIVVSRDQLLDRVWGMTYPGGTRTVDVHVAQLRRKLGRPQLIRTVRGAGYKTVRP